MKIVYFTILMLAAAGNACAQQLPQYSTWLFNSFLYNPAAAGNESTLVANGVYRQQWIDLDGAPVSQHIDAHLPVYFLNSGAGLKIDNDQIGAHQTTQITLSWNYQIDLGASQLSFGASAGYQQYSLDGAKLRAPQGDYIDPNLQHNDDYLPLGRISIGTPVTELGIYFTSLQWEASLAALPVFSPVIKEQSPGLFRLQPQRHYVASTAWKWQASENLLVKPGLLIKTDFAATQMEVSGMLVWKEKFYGLLSYRGFTRSSEDAAVLSGGIRINDKSTVLYAYDLPLSALQTVQRGSHELTFRYQLDRQLGAGKLPPVIYNPRF